MVRHLDYMIVVVPIEIVYSILSHPPLYLQMNVRFRGRKYSEAWDSPFKVHAGSAKELIRALHSAGNNISFSHLGHAR